VSLVLVPSFYIRYANWWAGVSPKAAPTRSTSELPTSFVSSSYPSFDNRILFFVQRPPEEAQRPSLSLYLVCDFKRPLGCSVCDSFKFHSSGSWSRPVFFSSISGWTVPYNCISPNKQCSGRSFLRQASKRPTHYFSLSLPTYFYSPPLPPPPTTPISTTLFFWTPSSACDTDECLWTSSFWCSRRQARSFCSVFRKTGLRKVTEARP